MKNPGLPVALWKELDGRLWHATSCDGSAHIFAEGKIRPNIDVRYKNSFCPSLGCVCLFDFGSSAEDVTNQFNNWHGWLGHQQDSRIAIWLEIDRLSVANELMDAKEARSLWQRHLSKLFIPGVEACHKGEIPVEKLSRALLIARDDPAVFQSCNAARSEISSAVQNFKNQLPPQPSDDLIKIILNGRKRNM